MTLLPLLLHTSLGLALLAPFVAGHAVLMVQTGTKVRLQSWFGLTSGCLLSSTVPLAALTAGLFGPAYWPPYLLSPLVAGLTFLLGHSLWRAHLRRLHGNPSSERLLASSSALGLS